MSCQNHADLAEPGAAQGLLVDRDRDGLPLWVVGGASLSLLKIRAERGDPFGPLPPLGPRRPLLPRRDPAKPLSIDLRCDVTQASVARPPGKVVPVQEDAAARQELGEIKVQRAQPRR